MRSPARTSLLATPLALALAVSGCTVGPDAGAPNAEEQSPAAVTRAPAEAVEAIATDSSAAAAIALSQRGFERSETVVVAEAERPSLEAGRRAALALGVPLLSPHPGLETELERLGAQTVLGVGNVGDLSGLVALEPTDDAIDRAVAEQRATPVVERDAIVLADRAVAGRAARTTAETAGLALTTTRSSDPRADSEAAAALAARPDAPVVALGPRVGDDLAYTAAVVRAGREHPGGGHLIFPGRHVVALYGHPSTAALGMLGEQGPAATVQRAAAMADRYAALEGDDPVVSALEIIATVASGGAGKDGDYSIETPIEVLRPLVDAAGEAGQYVVLDLQPGRADFLAQAKRYRELLAEPHVGLALDPEWRLAPEEKPLERIGSVSIEEVERVADWLAALTRERALPQKLFVLHQFRTSMIRDRKRLRTDRPELATVIHVDGQGTQGGKQGTWTTLRRDAPDGVAWGWKNFVDEDTPMLTPAQTWAVRPRPDLVTYQ